MTTISEMIGILLCSKNEEKNDFQKRRNRKVENPLRVGHCIGLVGDKDDDDYKNIDDNDNDNADLLVDDVESKNTKSVVPGHCS